MVTSSILLFSCSKNDDDIKIAAIEEIKFNSLEAEILYLVNIHRTNNSLQKVSELSQPYTEALTHTKYMIEQGKTSHDNFDIRRSNLMIKSSAKVVLENVAAGYSTADSVMKQWLSSPSHRLVIENPDVQYMGISAQIDSRGINYYTQIFIGK
ncbi:MAG: CAP domain-containing protein [Flavobacteriaceae bacterium]|nr:CAP domain-containing protein [Flavobacteriaceae bacterium]